MSTSIDQAFVKQYEAEVALVFQRQGGYLRPTVRTKDNVVGTTTTFQKMGKGVATTKARNGIITPMNQTHTPIAVTLSDFYAGDWVDKLDEAKINHDERMAIATSGAWALGRQVDSQLLTAFATTTQSTVTWTYSSTSAIENNLLKCIKALDANEVPNDGQRYVVLTPLAFAAAMKVTSFASGDFVDPTNKPFEKGMFFFQWRRWMGAFWTQHNGLSGVGTSSAKGFAYHKYSAAYATGQNAGGVAQNQQVAADITWHGDRAAFFVNHFMSGGANVIDDTGVIPITMDDTQALPVQSVG
jgi:hypothetical protein